jgi:hypothetical protein
VKWQFVLAEDWASRAIAWWGQGYGGWSHVDAVMPDGWLLGARDDVIAPRDMKPIRPGVRLRPPHYEKWRRRVVVTLAVSPDEDERWGKFLLKQIGLKYDSGAIVDFFLGRRETKCAGHWICSGVQMAGLRESGKAFPSHIPDNQITPNTLYVLITAGLGGVMTEHTPH